MTLQPARFAQMRIAASIPVITCMAMSLISTSGFRAVAASGLESALLEDEGQSIGNDALVVDELVHAGVPVSRHIRPLLCNRGNHPATTELRYVPVADGAPGGASAGGCF